jgi:tRNA pseudouridine55 synthase
MADTTTPRPSGFLLIDKPAGITSHDVVDRVRRATGERRVGHAGTLDPFATGLLIVGVGRDATKRLDEFLGQDKEYVAEATLGATSDTDDCDGTITELSTTHTPSTEEVRDVLATFFGTHEQVVPSYAAKKVSGKKLYEYARAGLPVPHVTSSVTIHDIELLSYEWPRITFRVRASSGTYVRAIARDLGAQLGTGAYLTSLRRTAIGNQSVTSAHSLASLTQTTPLIRG